MSAADRRREFAAALHRLRRGIATASATISAPNCGIHIDGRDVKQGFIRDFEDHVRQLDWLAAQLTEGIEPAQDVSEEVLSLGDTDKPTEATGACTEGKPAHRSPKR
ncbi:MAG: hypothetical protein AB7E81_13670 [Hyphomicrobiaceae bacterium]